MNENVNLVEIFYITDEFCKEFYKTMEGYTLTENNSKKRKNKPSKLNDAEVITILIVFHLSGFRNLKHFYINYVQRHLTSYFPQTVSYNRFVELQKKALLPMVVLLKTLTHIAQKRAQNQKNQCILYVLQQDSGFHESLSC